MTNERVSFYSWNTFQSVKLQENCLFCFKDWERFIFAIVQAMFLKKCFVFYFSNIFYYCKNELLPERLGWKTYFFDISCSICQEMSHFGILTNIHTLFLGKNQTFAKYSFQGNYYFGKFQKKILWTKFFCSIFVKKHFLIRIFVRKIYFKTYL